MDKMELPNNSQQLVAWLKVLAEPRRLLIINLLLQGNQCNCELSDALGMAPNLISHHMNVLCQSGLVRAERDPIDARWIYYSVDQEALLALNTAFSAFFDPARIQSRRSCGPVGALMQLVDDLSER
ncbi:MAG: helix-turn-helix transcriptional regulator [Anaerolineae bacterium]|nr:helix-turn-helix transcriptional regulator [Anaerolineae bacterium]